MSNIYTAANLPALAEGTAGIAVPKPAVPVAAARPLTIRALLGDVEVVEATKTKPAKVVGVLAQSGEFLTAEGPVDFEEGDVLLESPDIRGRMWPVKSATFAKKYDMQS